MPVPDASSDTSSESGDESRDESTSAAKAAVRSRLRAARRELTAEQLSIRGRALSQVLQSVVPAGSAVAGYLPMPGEPDVRPFLIDHAEVGSPVYVPVIASSADRLLTWVPWSPAAQLRRSAFAAVEEPLGDRLDTDTLRERHPEGLTVLVPGLAVDHQGARMGQGGGFYDTAFGAGTGQPISTSGGPAAGHAPNLGPLRFIAVVHAEEVLPPGAFPVEPHDLRVHTIVTEREATTPRPL
ncbi:5-formyltetrahydrofolate cyclo-ligase [Nesterenkonia sp. E16_7]|uniref:5-formyltetrahydrofolate cyclo-ligase n=1 Tax=unclassified Nesterenkonia TaxID=2629769 RepID=UPI001A9276E1|nr:MULTISPECIES: 5-formyltetrahydrofolate cyclo-ligase [unclassified Nesterenkonia]MBO0596566.1 5-formyltetrahydrofolate cyclo-ligase [Nesterenkonia sp. E16_10]MBO0597237.1 5-formyltetrahydrofolate cyclo-ligase [Nesterenkonia sp. E16_7]